MGPHRLQAVLCAIGVAAIVSAATPAPAQEPFYKGKRITLLINFAAGGPTDIEGRLFAKYLARHIEGAPTMIVQNMDGAGGVIGAQYIGEVAPKDGSVIGYLSGTSWICRVVMVWVVVPDSVLSRAASAVTTTCSETDPVSSTTFAGAVAAVSTLTWSSSAFLKPLASTRTL